MIVQSGVQVTVTQTGMASGAGDMPVTPAAGAVAAAVGDVSEFLDIDVDGLAGPVPPIPPDRHRSGPVQAGQPRAAVPGQDLMHRRRVQAQPPRKPGRA